MTAFDYVRVGLEILGAVGVVASILVRLTPSPKDDEFVSKARQFLAMLSSPLLGGSKVTAALTHAPTTPEAPPVAKATRLPLKQR